MQDNRLTEEREQDLVKAIRAGKQQAIGELYKAYAPVLMGVIGRMVQHRTVAEEVLKETFMAIWTRIEVYDSSHSRFLTWALAVARGIAIEANKTEKYAYLIKVTDEGVFIDGDEKLTGTLQEEDMNVKAFGQLSPQEKSIIDLIYYKGLSCTQASEMLGLTEEELKSNLKKAIKHLGAEKTA